MQIIPTEDQEQITVIDYLESRGFKFTAIPNHTYNPHHSQQRKNHMLGLRKGLCDLMIALPGTGLLWIEMKRIKGSVTSAEQIDWIETLNQCPGNEARICHGATEAIAFIEEYRPMLNNTRSVF